MISIVWGGVALYNNYSNYANTTHPIPGKFCFCKMLPIPGNIQIWHSKQLAIFFWLDYMQLHSFYGIASNSAVFINHSACTSVSKHVHCRSGIHLQVTKRNVESKEFTALLQSQWHWNPAVLLSKMAHITHCYDVDAVLTNHFSCSEKWKGITSLTVRYSIYMPNCNYISPLPLRTFVTRNFLLLLLLWKMFKKYDVPMSTRLPSIIIVQSYGGKFLAVCIIMSAQ